MGLYQRVAYITPTGAVDVAPQSSGGGALGAGLFTTKRAFTYNTYAGVGVFDLDRQGLVALMAADAAPPWGGGPYADGGFRVVTDTDGSMLVMPFMEAMASLCSYGTADEGLSQAQLANTAKFRPVEMRCGLTTQFVRNCAAGVGIETRQVHLLNVTANNGFDDGHVALEAKAGGKWRLFDIPNDLAWSDGCGGLLSLAEIVAARPAASDVVKLAQSRVGRSFYPSPTAWVSAFYEMLFRSDAATKAWCERIYEVPGMAVAGGIVWGVPTHLSGYAAQIANYPGTNGTWSTLPIEDWVARFY